MVMSRLRRLAGFLGGGFIGGVVVRVVDFPGLLDSARTWVTWFSRAGLEGAIYIVILTLGTLLLVWSLWPWLERKFRRGYRRKHTLADQKVFPIPRDRLPYSEATYSVERPVSDIFAEFWGLTEDDADDVERSRYVGHAFLVSAPVSTISNAGGDVRIDSNDPDEPHRPGTYLYFHGADWQYLNRLVEVGDIIVVKGKVFGASKSGLLLSRCELLEVWRNGHRVFDHNDIW